LKSGQNTLRDLDKNLFDSLCVVLNHLAEVPGERVRGRTIFFEALINYCIF
jgi:hypothetical protein